MKTIIFFFFLHLTIFSGCSTSTKNNHSAHLTNLEVPYGLPDFEVSKRVVKKVYKAKKSDLVIIAFEEDSKSNYPYSFVHLYNYSKNKKKFISIEVPSANRLWECSFSKIGANRVKVEYHSCTECDEKQIHTATLIYNNESGVWATKHQK